MADNETKVDGIPEEEPVKEEFSDEVTEPVEDTVEEETSEEAPEDAEDEIKASGEETTEAEEEEAPEETVTEEEPEKKKISAFDKVAAITDQFIKSDIPDFRSGDMVKVHVKIIEGSKERIQIFEGVVTAIKHGGADRTFTVRKTSWGVGVERTFFIHSKKIDKIQVVRRGRVRRSKLYYLRDRAGKSARIKEQRMRTKP